MLFFLSLSPSLSPSLSVPLSLCLSLHSSLTVSTSLALGLKPSVINGQPENRIRGHRARAQVNQRGGGGGGKGWPDDLCGRDLRWTNGQAASAPCKPFPARICSLERSVAGDRRRPAQGPVHFICSLSSLPALRRPHHTSPHPPPQCLHACGGPVVIMSRPPPTPDFRGFTDTEVTEPSWLDR